jgi:hypothetical protein
MKQVVCTAIHKCPFEIVGMEDIFTGTMTDHNLKLMKEIDKLKADLADMTKACEAMDKVRLNWQRRCTELEKENKALGDLVESRKSKETEDALVQAVDELRKEITRRIHEHDALFNKYAEARDAAREQNNNDVIADAVKSILRREDSRLVLRIIHQAVFPGKKTMATNQEALKSITEQITHGFGDTK